MRSSETTNYLLETVSNAAVTKIQRRRAPRSRARGRRRRKLRVQAKIQNSAKVVGTEVKDKVFQFELSYQEEQANTLGSHIKRQDLQLLNEAVTLTNAFKDLSHMIHYGYDVSTSYLHITRKSWFGAFFPGCSPVKLIINATGTANFIVEFGDSQSFNCCQPDGSLDKELLQEFLEKLSIQGNHYYCPGLSETEADIVSDCTRLVRDRYPYKRWASDNCELYVIRTVGVSQNDRKSGFYRCRNCRLLLANEVKKGITEADSDEERQVVPASENIITTVLIPKPVETRSRLGARRMSRETRSPLTRISTQSANKRTLDRPSRLAKKAAATRMRVLQRMVTADSDEEIEDEILIGKSEEEDMLDCTLPEPPNQNEIVARGVEQVIRVDCSDTLAMEEILDD